MRIAFVVVSLVAFGVAYAAPIVSAFRLPVAGRLEPLPPLAIPAISFPTLAVPKLRQAPAVPAQATEAPPARTSRSSAVPTATRTATAPKQVRVPVRSNSYGIPAKQAASTTPADPFANAPVVSNDTGAPVTLPAGPAASAAETGNDRAVPPPPDTSAPGYEQMPRQTTPGTSVERLSAAGAPEANMAPATLTGEAVEAALARAISEWAAIRPDADLGSVTVGIDDLPDLELGRTVGNTITIDATAAGYGWTVLHAGDDTVRMDLLTAVRHEVGHVLGYDHGDGLMADTLAAGESRAVPAVAPAKDPAPATTTSSGSATATSSTETTAPATTASASATGESTTSTSAPTPTTATSTSSAASTGATAGASTWAETLPDGVVPPDVTVTVLDND